MFRDVLTAILLFLGSILSTAAINAQTTIPAATDNAAAVTKYFEQLRRIFGKFSQSDLQQVFQEANPIKCPELVQGRGEWKPVAFFNDKRELGAWYHETIDEVKTDLRTYTFKGVCTTVRSTIQL